MRSYDLGITMAFNLPGRRPPFSLSRGIKPTRERGNGLCAFAILLSCLISSFVIHVLPVHAGHRQDCPFLHPFTYCPSLILATSQHSEMHAITVFHHIPEFSPEALQLDSIMKATWQQKALKALETSNDTKTELIMKLVPTDNFNAIEAIIKKREDPRLDAVLAVARREQEDNAHSATSELTPFFFSARTGYKPTSSTENNPSCEGPGDFADEFADILHNDVVKKVRDICFVRWASYVFGVKEHAVRGFLQWASRLSQSLHNKYMHSPKKRKDYEEVEKVCYTRCLIGTSDLRKEAFRSSPRSNCTLDRR